MTGNGCRTVNFRLSAFHINYGLILLSNELIDRFKRQLGLCLRDVGFFLHTDKLFIGLELALGRFRKVLPLSHCVIREGLRFLSLILTFVELSVLQQLASVRSSELLSAAFVALARQLRRLIVFASSLARDCHIIIVSRVICVRWVLGEYFGRL